MDMGSRSQGLQTNSPVRSLARLQPQWMVLGLILLTIAMRLPELQSRSLWYDEAFSILFARQGPTAMLYGTITPVGGAAAEEHPLLYYSILWVWMKFFGEGILAVRSLSVVVSVGLLLALMKLAREIFDQPVGLMTGLLFALSPFQIHYGQEARMYILLALFLVLAALTGWRGVTQHSRRDIFLFGILTALAMYTHILAIFFLVPLVLILLAKFPNRDSVGRIFMGSIIGFLLYLPWLIQLPGQLTKVQQAYWIEKPGLSTLIQTVIGFVGDVPIRETLLPFMLVISLVIFSFALMEGVRLLRSRSDERVPGSLVLGLTWLPVALLFIISQVRPVYILRGLLPSGGLYLLAIAWVIVRARKLSSWTLALCLALGFVTGNIEHLRYDGFPYAPYAEINDYLGSRVASDDVVLHSNKLTMFPAFYDDPSLPHAFLRDPPDSGGDTLAYPTQEALGLFAEADPLQVAQDAPKVYFVVFQQEFDDYERLGFIEHPALASLKEHFVEVDRLAWGDLFLIALENQKEADAPS